jgi:hypothetical protein
MPRNIQIVKQSSEYVPGISSVKLVVEAINPENMSDKIFVKQRIHNFSKGDFEDVFAAVCTPAQLEDLQEDSPADGTSYFRANAIELVSETEEHLDTVFGSMLYEVKKLLVDLDAMDRLKTAVVYNVPSEGEITTVP